MLPISVEFPSEQSEYPIKPVFQRLFIPEEASALVIQPQLLVLLGAGFYRFNRFEVKAWFKELDTDFKVVRSICKPWCDDEVIRVMKLMPKWIPGKYKDKPVETRYNLPMKIRLE